MELADQNHVRFNSLNSFFEKQNDARDCARLYDRVLYGGAAGGGKSRFLRWLGIEELIRLHQQYGVRGVRIGVFCENYPVLEDRQISKIRFEVPEWLGRMNEQRHELHLAPEFGSGVLCFRNLDKPRSYLSAEFAKALFDEITQVKEEVYDFICSRLRWPGVPEFENCAVAATNPGGIGHAWVKRRWIDGQLSARESRYTYAFVPSKALDNPHLPDGYWERLRSLPERLARAYADGDWTFFEGQYFTEWRPEVHQVTPFAIPKDWLKFRSADYGHAKPAAMLWWAVNPWFSQLICYRELYGPGMTPKALAENTLAMTPEGEDIVYTVLDPACWSSKAGEKSIAEQMLLYGLACQPGVNDRIDGWSRVRLYLEPFEYLAPPRPGEAPAKPLTVARMVFFSNCVSTIRTLPALVHDEIRVEDVDTDSEDHAPDAVRYAVMSRPDTDLTAQQREVDDWRARMREEHLKREGLRRREETGGARTVGV